MGAFIGSAFIPTDKDANSWYIQMLFYFLGLRALLQK